MDPRICIVGAGNLSSLRIYPYIGAAGARLVGVCDLDKEKAETNARRFGGKVYDDMEKMLDTEKPDGVMICINMDMHVKLAPLALKRRIPVYTEKPAAPTAASCLELARTAQESGTLCMTAFKKRYAACYARAKQWLAGFPEEDRYLLSIDYASGQYGNKDQRRSFLFDFAIHVIDLNQYLFGDAAQVAALAKGPDAYAVSIKYTNGSVGTLSLTDGRCFGLPTEEVELTVKGGNAMTIHNSSTWKIMENQKAVEWREPPTFISRGDSGLDTGHLAEIQAFLGAIRGEDTVRSSIYESYKSMVLYEAILESVETGAIIQPQYGSL